ncbi:hypothetical protein CW304_32000 [Bacillus sp. UFRGS-B20]|nr:hypothetical protein CW304_32000 [Bacillus sp. UFRGS-B20]
MINIFEPKTILRDIFHIELESRQTKKVRKPFNQEQRNFRRVKIGLRIMSGAKQIHLPPQRVKTTL